MAPSVGAEVALENLYGYGWSDIYDASTLGEVLVSVGDAYKTSSNVKYNLGDKIFWTNSLDHIGELELRRKFLIWLCIMLYNRQNRSAGRLRS